MNYYCEYYQAEIERAEIVKVVSILKSFDNVCFDRCYDTQKNIFEFFVPTAQEAFFLSLLSYFEKQGIVRDLKKLPNRIESGEKF